MSVYLSWNNGSDQLYFDLTITENIDSRLMVTEHPVENGPDVTENARQPPENFAATVFVSNAPLVDKNGLRGGVNNGSVDVLELPTAGLVAAVGTAVNQQLYGARKSTVPTSQWDVQVDAVQYTLQLLQWLQSSKTLLRVVTSKKLYQNMLLTQVTLNRTAQDGTGGTFQLSFKQLRVVNLRFTNVETPVQPKDEKQKNKGSKGTTTPKPKRSLLVAAGQAAGIVSATPATPTPGN